jgi:hypothetical protein
MKIVYVVDKKDSALYIAAKSRSITWGGEIILANYFSSPYKLLQQLINYDADLVLPGEGPILTFYVHQNQI